MYIKELVSMNGTKGATIHLDYNEIRDTSNALYRLISGTEPTQDYTDLKNKFQILFDLVKFGMITNDTMKNISKTLDDDGPIVKKEHLEYFKSLMEGDDDKIKDASPNKDFIKQLAVRCMESYLQDD